MRKARPIEFNLPKDAGLGKKKVLEVWKGVGVREGWTWYVLSKNNFKDTKPNPYARWYCLVTSTATSENGDEGDCYREHIKSVAERVS